MTDCENCKNEVNIYRYKFTEHFMKELYVFSKIHQYDDRHTFKEAWKRWTEENEQSVSHEIKRLQEIGYDGDILDKMFKSARYYFRKKTERETKPKRRQYLAKNKEILQMMDEHVRTNIYKEDYKPSEGFLDFCKNNKELIREEIEKLLQAGVVKEEIQNKIKKTYKNRYFTWITK
jgi:hypothetical protein